jgi:hypothetical protein
MIWLISPTDGRLHSALTIEQYTALPGHVAARYLARMSLVAALETSQRIQREKEGKN